jgi:hypothetical protein
MDFIKCWIWLFAKKAPQPEVPYQFMDDDIPRICRGRLIDRDDGKRAPKHKPACISGGGKTNIPSP